VTNLEVKLRKMGTDIKKKGHRSERFGDSMVSARILEENDAITNNNKEDRLIITGMSNKMLMPQTIQDRKKWLLEMVEEVIDKIEQGAAAKIIWANQGRRNENEQK
jgi:hypothetical protein